MAKSKANYVPNKNIKSITIQRGKKTTEVKNKDILDGAYVKKGVKFKKGGNSDDKYVVNVGNIGNITCKTMAEADKTYKEYVNQSKSGVGRASGEYVGLYVDGEPVKEHFGTNEDEYGKGGKMSSKKPNIKKPSSTKKPKMVRTIFEEEYFEDYGKGGNQASYNEKYAKGINVDIAWNMMDIEERLDVLSKMTERGYVRKEDLYSGIEREDYIDLPEEIKNAMNVNGKSFFRTGGVAGSKHVDVTKGYRLPHGYKAVRGEDKNKNYSKGKPKVRVDKGWRLPKGYEVVEGGYNKKYEDGGMMANGGNVDYAWLVKYDEPNDEGDYEEILSNEVVIAEEDNKTRAIMKKAKMGQVITHNDADINGYAVSYTKVPLPKGKKKDSFGGRYGYEDGGMMANGGRIKNKEIYFPDLMGESLPSEIKSYYDKGNDSIVKRKIIDFAKKFNVKVSNYEHFNDNGNIEFYCKGKESDLKSFYKEFFDIKENMDDYILNYEKVYGVPFFETDDYKQGGNMNDCYCYEIGGL